MTICKTKKCDKEAVAFNYCQYHLIRQRYLNIPWEYRFWDKVEKTGNCWKWLGTKNDMGYGQIRIDGKIKYAHRLSYELAGNAIPDRWVIDHLCRNPGCCNPDHLEAVEERVNIQRGDRWRNKRKQPLGAQKNGDWYMARKSFSGKSFYLGNYRTPEEASIVYQTAVLCD